VFPACNQLIGEQIRSFFGFDHSVFCLHSITGETVSVGFEQTFYQTNENGSLNEELCAVIGNLTGDLECNLTVTFFAVSTNKSGKDIFMFSSSSMASLR